MCVRIFNKTYDIFSFVLFIYLKKSFYLKKVKRADLSLEYIFSFTSKDCNKIQYESEKENNMRNIVT